MGSLFHRLGASGFFVVAGLGLTGFVAARWTTAPAGTESVSHVAPLVDPLAGSASAFPGLAQAWLKEWASAGAEGRNERVVALGPLLSGEDPERATRAATLLGAALSQPRASAADRELCFSLLAERLEMRADTGERWSVGADVVAARALDGLRDDSQERRGAALAVLVPLAVGDGNGGASRAGLPDPGRPRPAPPHPSLAVRVECAASALLLLGTPTDEDVAGTDQALTGFLLAVLRAETPAQELSPRTWPRITTLAWVKTRAASALAARTGLKNLFRPDGSWAHQVEEAARFEAKLR